MPPAKLLGPLNCSVQCGQGAKMQQQLGSERSQPFSQGHQQHGVEKSFAQGKLTAAWQEWQCRKLVQTSPLPLCCCVQPVLGPAECVQPAGPWEMFGIAPRLPPTPGPQQITIPHRCPSSPSLTPLTCSHPSLLHPHTPGVQGERGEEGKQCLPPHDRGGHPMTGKTLTSTALPAQCWCSPG